VVVRRKKNGPGSNEQTVIRYLSKSVGVMSQTESRMLCSRMYTVAGSLQPRQKPTTAPGRRGRESRWWWQKGSPPGRECRLLRKASRQTETTTRTPRVATGTSSLQPVAQCLPRMQKSVRRTTKSLQNNLAEKNRINIEQTRQQCKCAL
jgi:hypothetical protein